MKKVILFLLLALSFPVHAQMSKSSIQSQILSNWPDNTTNAITASKLRVPNQLIVNSYLDLNGATSFQCPASQVLKGFSTLSTPSCDILANIITSKTGTGALVFATSPTLITPNLGTPSVLVLTSATGLPVSGIIGLGTGVATAIGVNVGTAGAVVVNGGALGTPASGVGTNLTALNVDNVTLGSAWSSFSANITCGTATFTTTSSRSKTLAKTMFVELDFTFTAIGTCTNAITITLPATAQSGGSLVGREIVSFGGGAVASILPSATTGFITKATAAVFVNGERYVISGLYEIQ
jgi:hypothetical protein